MNPRRLKPALYNSTAARAPATCVVTATRVERTLSVRDGRQSGSATVMIFDVVAACPSEFLTVIVTV